MKDKYIMDGCKLMWHPERVFLWNEGLKISPIHIDVGLSKGCNIRCHYCFGVLQGNFYKKGSEVFFPREPLLRYMKDAGKIGVKSIAIVGEAEPMLNPNVYDAIIAGYKAGVDMSLGTNGILIDRNKMRKPLKVLKWIRFNISAASDKSYRLLHGSRDFDTAISNIRWCVLLKQIYKLDVTIGLQMVLTPADVKEVVPLAKLGRQLGVDYFVVKQCSDTVSNDLGYYNIDYDIYKDIFNEAEQYSYDYYNVIIKRRKMKDQMNRDYSRCLGTPFLLYSSGDGKLFPCGAFFEEKYWKDFMMGDLVKDSFIDIFNSSRYWEVVDKVKNMDISGCYAGCRTNEINSYLWKLKHPPEHLNFV